MIGANLLRTRSAVAAVLALAALGAAAYDAVEHRGVGDRRAVLDDPYRTPYRVLTPDRPATDGVAILLHGWRCSGAMMLPLARMLARNGVTAVVPDFPGHGRSPVALQTPCLPAGASPERCRIYHGDPQLAAVTELLPHLLDAEHLRGRPLALIGHSSGGDLVDELELPDARVVARVNLEGRTSRLSAGRNELLVASPRYLLQIPIGGGPARPDTTFGDFPAGTAYKLRVLPRRHLELIRDEEANREMLGWLAAAFGARLGSDVRPLAWPAEVTAAALAGLVLVALFSLPPPRPAPSPLALPRRAVVIALVALALGAVAGVLLTARLPAFGLVFRRLEAEDLLLPAYLLTAGAFAAAAVYSAARRAVDARAALRGAAVGAAVFAALIATAGGYVDAHLHHLLPSPARAPRIGAMVAAVLPLAAALRALAPAPTRPWRRAGAVLGLWAATLAVYALGNTGKMRRDALLLLVLPVVVEPFAAALERRVGPAAAATLTALVLGWFFAVAYPLLG